MAVSRRLSRIGAVLVLLVVGASPGVAGGDDDLPAPPAPEVSARLLDLDDLPELDALVGARVYDIELADALATSAEDLASCDAGAELLESLLPADALGGYIGVVAEAATVWWGYVQTVFAADPEGSLDDATTAAVVQCRVDRVRATLAQGSQDLAVEIVGSRMVGEVPVAEVLASYTISGIRNHLYFDIALMVDDGWYSTVMVMGSPLLDPSLTSAVIEAIRERL